VSGFSQKRSLCARREECLEKKASAFHWLEKAYKVRDIGLVFHVFPQWDSLRSDKRFPQLVRRCGFPL
jgi:hypothetical protein